MYNLALVLILIIMIKVLVLELWVLEPSLCVAESLKLSSTCVQCYWLFHFKHSCNFFSLNKFYNDVLHLLTIYRHVSQDVLPHFFVFSGCYLSNHCNQQGHNYGVFQVLKQCRNKI